MNGTLTGVLDESLLETPITVLDFETTGLDTGYDRVVEVSVVRIDPGEPPQLVLDTLINPDRRVTATEIHGITDRDVSDAPRFRDVAGDLLDVLSGSVVAAHNVYFDLRFLQFELGRLGLSRDVPHLCTMHARPLLGLKACSLLEACLTDQINFTPTHTSRSDSMAAALLWMRYRDAFLDRQILTFRGLTQLGRRYKFFASFKYSPFSLDCPLEERRTEFKPRC